MAEKEWEPTVGANIIKIIKKYVFINEVEMNSEFFSRAQK